VCGVGVVAFFLRTTSDLHLHLFHHYITAHTRTHKLNEEHIVQKHHNNSLKTIKTGQ
jgi:hypothetical protein